MATAFNVTDAKFDDTSTRRHEHWRRERNFVRLVPSRFKGVIVIGNVERSAIMGMVDCTIFGVDLRRAERGETLGDVSL